LIVFLKTATKSPFKLELRIKTANFFARAMWIFSAVPKKRLNYHMERFGQINGQH